MEISDLSGFAWDLVLGCCGGGFAPAVVLRRNSDSARIGSVWISANRISANRIPTNPISAKRDREMAILSGHGNHGDVSLLDGGPVFLVEVFAEQARIGERDFCRDLANRE